MIISGKSEQVPDELSELDNLYAEVAVLRDANAALTKARDQLLSERDDLRAALAHQARPALNVSSIELSLQRSRNE
ncbi:hypothetical protein [Methylocapsa acidiphila]|uniref:hypothetical protein n=1 Tax=Methylocapsa acidiphila TaxID=133552 RepID=UPI00055C7D33|nr:hypothetical protein [Methylocapsa acidiphila]